MKNKSNEKKYREYSHKGVALNEVKVGMAARPRKPYKESRKMPLLGHESETLADSKELGTHDRYARENWTRKGYDEMVFFWLQGKISTIELVLMRLTLPLLGKKGITARSHRKQLPIGIRPPDQTSVQMLNTQNTSRPHRRKPAESITLLSSFAWQSLLSLTRLTDSITV